MWAKANNFTSMLPKDSKAWWEKAKANVQMSLDPHLEEMPMKKYVIPYSDTHFQQVAVKWLVSTDQVCNKLSHQCFCLSVKAAAGLGYSV